MNDDKNRLIAYWIHVILTIAVEIAALVLAWYWFGWRASVVVLLAMWACNATASATHIREALHER